MEPTSTQNDLKTRCAQATRGLIVLDRATWEKCGEKPQGLPEAIVPKQVATQHNRHGGHEQGRGGNAAQDGPKGHQDMQNHRKMEGQQDQPKAPGKTNGHMHDQPGMQPAPSHQSGSGHKPGKSNKHSMRELDHRMGR